MTRHLDGLENPIENIHIVSTYLNSSANSVEELIRDADIIVSQNPKVGHWANYGAIKHLFKSNVKYLQLEFWRFNGFWPVSSKLERVNPHFWFPVDEFIDSLSFEDYMNYEVGTKKIIENFELNLEKLENIDRQSDISMLDFVIKNYKSSKVLSDEWHPYPSFFEELARRILDDLGIEYNDVGAPPLPMGINNDRHRIIQTSVVNELGLSYDEYHKDLFYFGKKISLESFYYFSSEISSEEHIRNIVTQNELKKRFYAFLGVS